MGWFDSLKRERKEAQAVTEVKEPIIESVPAVDNKEEAVEEEYQVIEREPAPQIEDQSRTVPVKTYAEKKAVTHVVGQTKVIAIINQKGGVGKTTTAINLSACLAEKGQKVLAIDMDPQGNMTSGLGIDKDEVEKNIYDLMIGQAGVDEVLQKEAIENLDVIPTSIDLSAAEIELIGVDDKEFIIRNAVQPIKDDYDYIIIDCPPSLSMLTINAMTTADSVLVPIQCEYYALEGLSQLIHTVELVKERLNPVLEIEGVVFTMYDARTNLSLQVVENVKENLQQNIYKTIIPRNIRLAEAPSYGMPINLYDPKSTGASAYQRLADEVMNRE